MSRAHTARYCASLTLHRSLPPCKSASMANPSATAPLGHWRRGALGETLDDGCVQVWRVALDAPLPAPIVLSTEECARSARMQFPVDGERWANSRRWLRTILGRLLGCPPHAVPLRGNRGQRPD